MNKNKKINTASLSKKSVIALALFSSVACAQSGINFEEYELTLSAGSSFYDIEGHKDNAVEYGIGLSTDHKSDFFIDLMATQTDSIEFSRGSDAYDFDSSSLSASLNYNLLNTEKFNIYSGMGVSLSKSKTIGLDDGLHFSESKYNASPIVNVGAMYDINDSVSVGLKYRHNFDVDGNNPYNIKEMDSDSVLLTLNLSLPTKEREVIKTETIYKERMVEVSRVEAVSDQSSVYFESGSHETDLSKETEQLAKLLSANSSDNYLIYVNAHASKTGSEAVNQRVADKRGQFIKQELVKALSSIDSGIESKIIVNKYGYRHHVADPAASQRADISLSIF